MYKIKITGPEAATRAARWLKNQKYDWNIDVQSVTGVLPVYTFSFSQEAAASHFALRWT
jgi:hypothetical protein